MLSAGQRNIAGWRGESFSVPGCSLYKPPFQSLHSGSLFPPLRPQTLFLCLCCFCQSRKSSWKYSRNPASSSYPRGHWPHVCPTTTPQLWARTMMPEQQEAIFPGTQHLALRVNISTGPASLPQQHSEQLLAVENNNQGGENVKFLKAI